MMENSHLANTENRGFANARNNKLRLLAKRKRSQPGQAGRDGARNTQAAALQHRQKIVRLSDALRANPQHFDAYKVACVEWSLTTIDELPEQYHAAEVVYISKNNLQTLQGIEQFSQLRVLSAADNLLRDISELQILQAACSKLQVASFERNPMCHMPNYRNKVIQMLPKLQMLDGQGVSSQDRQRAAAALKQEAACMAVMMSNACMVHKLVRTAELLQLHTELRRTLFGSASVLRKSFLPSAIPLDLLKFLKLWDYEGSLTDGDRRIICDALTRETVRVHKQLQHAALQLKGPAQLPELHAWDAAFSQVMLAQQRTIIQLVELVNGLHDEAAKAVAGLSASAHDGSARLEREEQDATDQQHQAERERLIVDLRDAALELAGVLASSSPRAGDPASAANSPYTASPMKPCSALMSPEQQKQCMPQQASQAQQQLNLQLQQWSPNSQQVEEDLCSAVGLPQQQQQQQQQPGQSFQSTPTRIPKPPRQLSSHQSIRLRPLRASAPAGMLQQHQAAVSMISSPGSLMTVATPVREVNTPGRGLSRTQSRIPKLGQIRHSTQQPGQQPPQQQQQQQLLDRCSHQSGSSIVVSTQNERSLSPTARKLLQHAGAAACPAAEPSQQGYTQQQQQRQQQVAEDILQPDTAMPLQEMLQVHQQQTLLQPQPAPQQQLSQNSPLLQQQAEWMEAGFASETPQGPRSSAKKTGRARVLRNSDADCYRHYHQTNTVSADAGLLGEGQQRLLTVDRQHSQRSSLEQRQSSSSLSLPASTCSNYDQQQQQQQQQEREQQELPTGSPVVGSPSATSILQVPEGLAYLTHNNIVYERIERFTPASARSPGPTQRSPAAADDVIDGCHEECEDESTQQVDVPAMIAAAQTVARLLFAVEEVPGACSFFSPYSTEAQPQHLQQQQQQQIDAQHVVAAQSSEVAEVYGEHHDVIDALQEARSPSVAGTRQSVAGEISFACGKSSSASPESLTEAHAAWQQHRQQSETVAEQQQQQQQQHAEQQQQLLWLLLNDGDTDNEAESPSAAAVMSVTIPDTHQPHLDSQKSVQQSIHSQPSLQAAAAAAAANTGANESHSHLLPSQAPVQTVGAASAGASVFQLSRESSVSSSGDLGALRQQPFASVTSPAGDAHAAVKGSRASGLASYVSQQQQQQQQRHLAAVGGDQSWPQQSHSTADLSAVGHQAAAGATVASPRASGKLDNLSSPYQQRHQQLVARSATSVNSPRGSRLQPPAVRQSSVIHPENSPMSQQQLLASTAAVDVSARALHGGRQLQHAHEQSEHEAAAAARDASSPRSPRTSGVYFSQTQQQSQQVVEQTNNSDSICQRPSCIQQPAVAVPVQRVSVQEQSASPISARQSTRGVTLEDWSPQSNHQQTLTSTSPSLPAHAAASGLHSTRDMPTLDDSKAAAVHRPESPVSRCSSRASMVDVVAQTLGHASAPLPAQVKPNRCHDSRSPGNSPRGSHAVAAGARTCSVPAVSLVEAAAVVTAAMQAAAGNSRPASPRPSGAANSITVGRTSQQPAAVVTPAASTSAVIADQHLQPVAAQNSTPDLSRRSTVKISRPPVNLQPLAVSSPAARHSAPPSPTAAAAATSPTTPTKKVLADLQDQLVMLVVEKAAIEKQLQIGMGEIQQLQLKVAAGQTLEQTVQHMQADLLKAQEQLQQASSAAQQQAEQNHQLLLQMQQVEGQLTAHRAQQAQAALAEKLSCRVLCHRILLHFHQAAQASVVWRQLKASAVQHRQQTVTKAVLRSWRHIARVVRSMRVLEEKMNRRLLQSGFNAWVLGAQAQRFAAQQNEAAYSHWYGHLVHKVLCHWRYYTYQVKVLGVEPPSSPSTASASSDVDQLWLATEQQQQQQQQPEVSLDGLLASSWEAAAGERHQHGMSRASLPSISARFGPVLGGVSSHTAAAAAAERNDVSIHQQKRREWQPPCTHVLRDSARQQASQSSMFASRRATRCSKRRTVIFPPAEGLSLLEDETAAVEPLAAAESVVRASQRGVSNFTFPCSSEAQPRCSTLQGTSPAAAAAQVPGSAGTGRASVQNHQQQQRNKQPRVRSATICSGAPQSLFGCSTRQPRMSVQHPSDSGNISILNDRRCASMRLSAVSTGASASVAADIPLNVHVAFVHEAKAQRLRRKWLIRRSLAGWQQLMQIQAAHARDLATADRYSSKHRLRRTWLTWRGFVQQQQHERTYPDGLDNIHLQLLQQHSKLKQRMLLLRVVQAWWAAAQRAAAARTAAEAVAAEKQRQLLRGMLRAMQQRVQYGYHKQQLVTRANSFRDQKLLQCGLKYWWRAVLVARAADPLRKEASKQVMWKVVLRWHLLSAHLAAGAARELQVDGFKNSILTKKLARVFGAWQHEAVRSAREQWLVQLQQAQQQVVLLQQQNGQQQQQHVAGVRDIENQMQQLQRQLQEALSDKQQLQKALATTEQRLQHQAQDHQQQMSQVLSDHRATVAMLQQQVEQAARTTDETADQLEQLQQQQSSTALEQQQKQQQLQHDLVHQQQRQEQLEQRELELQQQLANSRSQCKQLASQLKRCSEKLEQQTQAVQKLTHELDIAQQQVAAARHALRDQNLSLTHQALAAQQEKLDLQQQLCKQSAAAQVLKQQLDDVEQQLKQHRKSSSAAAADHVLEVERLRDMIGLKEQSIAQMQENAATVQGQLASQQAKVLAEVEQLRNGWSQAKQIIKQQRRTIKAQDLQLRLALGSAAATVPALSLQQQRKKQQYLAAVTLQDIDDVLATAALGESTKCALDPFLGIEGVKYPITAHALQQQLKQQQ